MVGVARDHQQAVGDRSPPPAERDRLRVPRAIGRGALGGERKGRGGVAPGRRHRRLEQADEDALHEGVLVADHDQQGLAAADGQRLADLFRLARAEHLLRRPAEGRGVVEAERRGRARQVVRRELRRHGAQRMAGQSHARAVNAPRQQAAQTARRAGRAHGGERGAAGLLLLAEQPRGSQRQPHVVHAPAKKVAHHRHGALHPAGDELLLRRVEAGGRREPPSLAPEREAVEIGDDLGLAEHQRVGALHLLGRGAPGEGRIRVVERERQAAVRDEGGRRHHVAARGEKLGEGAPHAVASAEAVGENHEGKPPLGGPGADPRSERGVEGAPANLAEGVPARRPLRFGEGSAAAKADVPRRRPGRRGDSLRQGAIPKVEVEERSSPPARCGAGGARPGEAPARGVRRRRIPQLERRRPRLARRLHPAQEGAVFGAAVGGVPGVEALMPVHGEAGERPHGVVAVSRPQGQGAQLRRRAAGVRDSEDEGERQRRQEFHAFLLFSEASRAPGLTASSRSRWIWRRATCPAGSPSGRGTLRSSRRIFRCRP